MGWFPITDKQFTKLIGDSQMYTSYQQQLFDKYRGVLTREEIDQACQEVMSHYGHPGLVTMRLLLSDHFATTRDFLHEVGKILPDAEK